MNDYITIDSKKYQVISNSTNDAITPQKMVRYGILGNSIVTTGPGSAILVAAATLYIQYTPPTGYGTVSDLKTAIEKKTVSYSSHYPSGTQWNQGTYNITITNCMITLLSDSLTPENGYLASIEWETILT